MDIDFLVLLKRLLVLGLDGFRPSRGGLGSSQDSQWPVYLFPAIIRIPFLPEVVGPENPQHPPKGFISKGNQCLWLFPLQVIPHMGVVVRGPNPVLASAAPPVIGGMASVA